MSGRRCRALRREITAYVRFHVAPQSQPKEIDLRRLRKDAVRFGASSLAGCIVAAKRQDARLTKLFAGVS